MKKSSSIFVGVVLLNILFILLLSLNSFSQDISANDSDFTDYVRWLESKARYVVNVSKRIAYDNTVVYSPDGTDHYKAFWVRDFAYMIEGAPDIFPVEDIEKGFIYLIKRQKEDGTMPDRVEQGGKGIYLVIGLKPPTDNPQFMVKIAYEYTRITNDLSLFSQYKDNLIKGMRSLNKSASSSLIYVDPNAPHSTFGYTDVICKTGEVLFSSLLYYEASLKLAELFGLIGDTQNQDLWNKEALAIKQDIQNLWNPSVNMFNAASIDCSQPDIWGSAFAAYIGIIPDVKVRLISKYLVNHYSEIIKRGQARHLVKGTYWEKKLWDGIQAGTYQNGAYWATPVGWIAYVISKTNLSLAKALVVEMVQDFQKNGIYECINDGYANIKNFADNATLPLKGIKRMIKENNIPYSYSHVADGYEIYPNPFYLRGGPAFIIFDYTSDCLEIKICAISGKLVRTLYNGSGRNQIAWDAKNDNGKKITAGIYFYRITNNKGKEETGKLTIAR